MTVAGVSDFVSGSLPDRPISASTRAKIVLLLALIPVHFAFTFLAAVPGYLSFDEAYYHWMTKSFYDTWSLALWNGYEEFPSLELQHAYLKLTDGNLYPAYPYLFPALCFPFYWIAGFFGLFVFNSISFVAVVALCLLAARRLFDDMDLALNSCLILVLATYAWEYSQAAWPHAVSMLFTMGAFYLFVRSYYAHTKWRAPLFALGAGFVAGFAPGIRVDAVLLIPGLVLPFLFARPWRPAEIIMVLAGAIPGLIALTLTNFVKFGQLSPLSYGQARFEPIPHTGLAAVGGALLVGAWVITRPRYSDFLSTHRSKISAVAATVFFFVVLILPQARELLGQMLINAYVSLVDIRWLDPNIVWSPMTRSAGGGVIYIGAHKKALLQSLPFLVLIFVPIAVIIKRAKDVSALAILSIILLIFVGYFVYSFIALEGGGGLCLNLRYYLPLLPFLSILCAYAIKELMNWIGAHFPLGVGPALIIGLVVGGTYFALTTKLTPSIDALEFPLLALPLLLSGALLITVILCWITRGKANRPLQVSLSVLLIAALVWSGVTAYFYDYPHHRHGRAVHRFYSEQLLRLVPEDCIFFSANRAFTAAVMLKDKEKVRIAVPEYDGFKDFPRLLEFHLKAGRRAFAFFPSQAWNHLRNELLKSYTPTPIASFPETQFILGEIAPRKGP